MKSLVIGGTGQLGANLVRALLGCGDQVRVLHRSTSNTFTIDGLDIERVVGDLNDESPCAWAVRAGMWSITPPGIIRL